MAARLLALSCVLVSAAAAPPAARDFDNDVDVAIVGAGYAGLTAAWTILEANRNRSRPLRVHVIEADTRVGGRTLNVDVLTNATSTATDDVIELGGEWLAPEHHEAMRLASPLTILLLRRPAGLRPIVPRRLGYLCAPSPVCVSVCVCVCLCVFVYVCVVVARVVVCPQSTNPAVPPQLADRTSFSSN